jgi:glycosyltransferase involved in cell wall biosynthesis
MLQKEFGGMGHAVTVLRDGDEDEIQRLPDEGEVFGLYLRSPFVANVPVRGFIGFCAYLPLTVFRLYRFLSARRIDIVSIQYPTHSSVYFSLLRPFSTWKVVTTFHGNDVHDISSLHWTTRRITRWLLSSSDKVVTVSHSLFVKLSKIFPRLKCNHAVIPPATPIDFFTTPIVGASHLLPPRFILTAGHLIHRKGLDVLLRAIVLLAQRGERINLVIAGEGLQRRELEEFARNNGISDHVIFLGDQRHEQVLTLLGRADSFVLASRAEGLPLVILEAMACGVPVVATAVDGVPEVIEHERTGLLVNSEDAHGMAAAILRLQQEEPLRKRLGTAGRARVVRDHSWSAVALKYVHTFESLRTDPAPESA